MTTQSNKIPKLSAGRYKLLIPCHPYREGLKTEKSSNASIISPVKPIQSETKSLPIPFAAAETKRLLLPPISNNDVQLQIDLVRQYIQDTEIGNKMDGLTTELLKNNILPYNPYPGYIRRYRCLAERFHMRKFSAVELKSKLDVPIFHLSNSQLASIKFPDVSIWGLDHILPHIHPKTIQSYRDILIASTVSSEQASSATAMKVSVLLSVYGPGIFKNSFYNDWLGLDTKLTIIVTSQDMSPATHAFARVIIEDIRQVISHKSFHILDLSIPAEDGNGWRNRSFAYEELLSILSGGNSNTGILEKLIAHATVSKRRTTLNYLMITSANNYSSTFIPMTKVFDLLLLQTPTLPPNVESRQLPSNLPPRLVPTTLPYQALLEGIFIEQSHAEHYLSTFQKYYNISGKRHKKPSLKSDVLQGDSLNAIVQAWQMKIASSTLESTVFTTTHYILLLHLAETKTKSFSRHGEDDLAIQICRLYCGSAALLHAGLSLLSVLQNITSPVKDDGEDVSEKLIAVCRSRLLDVLHTDLCLVSSEMKTLKDMVEKTLDTSFHNINRSKLQQLSGSLFTVILGLTEDALSQCPAILKYKSQIDSIYAHLAPASFDVANSSINNHGIPNSSWLDVDHSYVNKLSSIASSQAPKAAAAHYSTLQYCLNIHIDEVWKEFLQQLFLEEIYLSPNPHPLLVSLLRMANMSVLVMQDSEVAVTNRILQRKIVAVPGLSDVFNVTGTTAYGKKSSLIFLNLLAIRHISDLSSSVMISPPGETVTGLPLQLDSFQLTVCGGLVASSTFYGSVCPHLGSLELDEHCFMKGPQNDIHSGLVSFANKIFSHLEYLQVQGAILDKAVFGDVHLNLKDVISSSARFESEFTATVMGHRFVCFSFLYPLEWRYILVKKRILVYFVEKENNRTTSMFRHSEISDQTKRTIFLHPDDAAFCFRSVNTAPTSFTSIIKELVASRDWAPLTEQMLAQAQLFFGGDQKDPEIKLDETLAKAIVAYCYRYYNAPPGKLDYVMSLNSALQSVLMGAVNVLSENGDLDVAINRELVEKMVDEYTIKLNEVVKRPGVLAPSTLCDYLSAKLLGVASRDRNSNSLKISYNRNSVEVLQEVNGIIVGLRNTSAGDLLKASTSIFDFIGFK